MKSISRRRFVQHSLVSCSALGLSLMGRSFISRGIADRYHGLKTRKYLSKVRVETRILDKEVFTEGPAVDRAGNVYFTNIPQSSILKWNPKKRVLNTFLTPSHKANGLRFRPNGKLLICEGDGGFVVERDLVTGGRKVLAERYRGKSLQSTNDLEYDARGRVYFSSRSGNPDLSKTNVKGLYRVDPDGSVYQLLAEPEVHMPNGVVLSPDGRTLYLIEAHPGDDHNRCILAFDVLADGSLSNRRTLIDFYPGRSGDGMSIDAEGNLYVAAGLHALRNDSETLDTKPGIHLISPEGTLLAYRETPVDTITNCTFGGKDLRTLYITCGQYLLSLRTKIPGKSSYRPNL